MEDMIKEKEEKIQLTEEEKLEIKKLRDMYTSSIAEIGLLQVAKMNLDNQLSEVNKQMVETYQDIVNYREKETELSKSLQDKYGDLQKLEL